MRTLLLALAVPLAALSADPSTAVLEREIARLATLPSGSLGIAAVHLETGRRISFRGTERFPMASTVKIPLAVELLSRVDRGEIRLDQMVTIEPSDLHPGSGTLNALFNKPGVALSVRNLMELMLLISDNSATDILMRLAGGPAAITKRMRELGIDGIDVNRSTAQLIANWIGVRDLPPQSGWTPELFSTLFSQISPEARKTAADRFNRDPRDTAAPDAMDELLSRIWRKDLLKPESASLLLDIMSRCQTGDARIKGMLPPGTAVAHKTGSIGGTTNDVGIVTLPDGAGHVAIAEFVKASEQPDTVRERAIAQIARAVYDYYLFTTPAISASIDYDRLAEHIVRALKPQPGERVLAQYDPDYFAGLLPPLKRRLQKSGAVLVGALPYNLKNDNGDRKGFAKLLANADIYLWLPLREGERQVTPAETLALKSWLEAGGVHREIHFHWPQGSVLADGLTTSHPAGMDEVYQQALDVDPKTIAAEQDRAVALLRSGTVRVRTPEGTDLQFRVGGRPFDKQDGDASAERAKLARVRVDREVELPAGVLRVAPLEDTANGRIVVPKARFGEAVAHNISFEIHDGVVTKIEASDHLADVESTLDKAGPASRRFREFGLGFNPKLHSLSGSDVLAYFGYGSGVVRLSLGDNQELGGAVRGGDFRRWFFFPDATVEVNGRALVRDGKLLN